MIHWRTLSLHNNSLLKKADRGSFMQRFTPRLLVCLFILLSLHSNLFVILQLHSTGWGEVARFGPRQSCELQTSELPISDQMQIRVSKNRKKKDLLRKTLDWGGQGGKGGGNEGVPKMVLARLNIFL